MSLWKRGRQDRTDFTVAGQRYRKRLGTTNLRKAKNLERDLIENAGRGLLSTTSRDRNASPKPSRRTWTEADALLAADPRVRRGAPDPRQEAFRRRAALGDHGDRDCRLSAHAPRRRHREPDDQHGRRRAVPRAQVLRPLAGAGRARSQPARTPASRRPRADGRGTDDGSSPLQHQTRNGSTSTAPRSSRRTRRCVPSRSSICDDAMSIWSRSSCMCDGARTRRAIG